MKDLAIDQMNAEREHLLLRQDGSALAYIDIENRVVEIAHPMDRIQITFDELDRIANAVGAELISKE
jgi:hypothetical protein